MTLAKFITQTTTWFLISKEMRDYVLSSQSLLGNSIFNLMELFSVETYKPLQSKLIMQDVNNVRALQKRMRYGSDDPGRGSCYAVGPGNPARYTLPQMISLFVQNGTKPGSPGWPKEIFVLTPHDTAIPLQDVHSCTETEKTCICEDTPPGIICHEEKLERKCPQHTHTYRMSLLL